MGEVQRSQEQLQRRGPGVGTSANGFRLGWPVRSSASLVRATGATRNRTGAKVGQLRAYGAPMTRGPTACRPRRVRGQLHEAAALGLADCRFARRRAAGARLEIIG